MSLDNVTISGSFRKFPEEVEQDRQNFLDRDVKVLSPKSTRILSATEGFVSLQFDPGPRLDRISENEMPSIMKLIENGHLRAIQQSDALWLTLPGGYCGMATTFEIGWALAHNVPVYYQESFHSEVKEPIVRAYANPIKDIDSLVYGFHKMPQVDPQVAKLFEQRIFPTREQNYNNATISVGPIIVDESKQYRAGQPNDILLVKTHKWDGKYSIVGGRLQKDEKLLQAFSRVVREQTGLDTRMGPDVCTFNEIPDSGYFRTNTSRVFVDKVVGVNSRLVSLDERAQESVWMPPKVALRDLDIEPNARKSIELYAQLCERN